MLWTTNAKTIGTMYLIGALSFGVSGLLVSWLMRGEIGGLGEQILFGDHQLYNVLITSDLKRMQTMWWRGCKHWHTYIHLLAYLQRWYVGSSL